MLPKHSAAPLLFGRLHHGLYYFHPSSFSNVSTTLTIPAHLPTPLIPSAAHLWHYRLGHAPFTKLSHIPDIPHSPTDTCLTCPLAKFTKLPYSLSSSRAPDLFRLIHLDIWGPYKTPSRGHHKYFITLVDDYSRTTWVSLLKLKSEVFHIIKTFVLMAKNQYGKLVKIFRSDNALKFADA